MTPNMYDSFHGNYNHTDALYPYPNLVTIPIIALVFYCTGFWVRLPSLNLTPPFGFDLPLLDSTPS